jgi:hypothetical protein
VSMTSQDYAMLAGVINENLTAAANAHDGAVVTALRTFAGDVARQLEYGNERFDRQRFLTACGIDEVVR